MWWIESMHQEKSTSISHKDWKHISWDPRCCYRAQHLCLFRKGCESMNECFRSWAVLFSSVRTSSSLLPKSALLYNVPGSAAALCLRLWERTRFKLSVRRVYFPSVAAPTGSWCSALSALHRPGDASRALAQGGRRSGQCGKARGRRSGVRREGEICARLERRRCLCSCLL